MVGGPCGVGAGGRRRCDGARFIRPWPVALESGHGRLGALPQGHLCAAVGLLLSLQDAARQSLVHAVAQNRCSPLCRPRLATTIRGNKDQGSCQREVVRAPWWRGKVADHRPGTDRAQARVARTGWTGFIRRLWHTREGSREGVAPLRTCMMGDGYSYRPAPVGPKERSRGSYKHLRTFVQTPTRFSTKARPRLTGVFTLSQLWA